MGGTTDKTKPDDLWAPLFARGRRRTYRGGEVIFQRDDPGEYALLIEDGSVEVSLPQLSGRKSVLNIMTSGDILGEIAILDGCERSADAMALTDVTALIVTRAQMRAHLSENPRTSLRLIEELCAKVRNASIMFETQSSTSGAERLARCLVNLQRKWGESGVDGHAVTQPFTQTELGDLAGVARENVNRHLRVWTKQRILTFDKGRIVIHDLDRLIGVAGL